MGLVVDDVVVMLEHLMRRLLEREGEGGDRATVQARLLAAAGEMARPLMGSTFSTLVVFAPLAFLGGVAGGFFKALAVTMTAALLISLPFSLFVAPVLAQAWLRRRDVEQAKRAERFMGGLSRGYAGLARRALARPGWASGGVAVVLLALGAFSYTQLASGFMPKMDEGGFVLDYKAKPGAALTDTDALLRRVEAVVRATPDVDSYSRRTGAQLGGGLSEADEGDFFIHLKAGRRRPVEEVMSDIRQRVLAQAPGLDIETAQLMEDLIGDLTAGPQPIEIKVFGPDKAALRQASQAVAGAIGKIRGVVEVVDGLRVAGDAIVFHVDPAAAELEGLDAAEIAKQVQNQIEGAVATQMQNGETPVDVRIWTPKALHDRVGALGDLQMRAPDGHTVPLGRVAKIEIQRGQAQITRENLQPFVGVTARLEHRDLGSAMVDVRRDVAGLRLPSGVRA